MTTKRTLYRVVHEFNQEGKLAVAHIYKAQCKVLFFWHTFGTAREEAVALEEILIHEYGTKAKGFFGRLWEVWSTKIKFLYICHLTK